MGKAVGFDITPWVCLDLFGISRRQSCHHLDWKNGLLVAVLLLVVSIRWMLELATKNPLIKPVGEGKPIGLCLVPASPVSADQDPVPPPLGSSIRSSAADLVPYPFLNIQSSHFFSSSAHRLIEWEDCSSKESFPPVELNKAEEFGINKDKSSSPWCFPPPPSSSLPPFLRHSLRACPVC